MFPHKNRFLIYKRLESVEENFKKNSIKSLKTESLEAQT